MNGKTPDTSSSITLTGTVFGLSRMGFASLGTVLLATFVAVYQYKKRRQYYGEWEDEE